MSLVRTIVATNLLSTADRRLPCPRHMEERANGRQYRTDATIVVLPTGC